MVEDKAAQTGTRSGGKIVYRRAASAPDGNAESGNASRNNKVRAYGEAVRIAPTLLLLIAGFALLLVLVVALGLLSVRRVEDVSARVLDLERQQGIELSVLLELRAALTALNNEARARADMEARGGILPPVPQRLNKARSDFNKTFARFDHLPVAATDKGATFRRDLAAYLDTTADLNRYSLEGYEKFRAVDAELGEMLRDVGSGENEVLRQSDELQAKAARSLRLLTWLALIVGAFVALVTVWEVQRRFKQVRQSLEATRREREFSAQILEGMVSAIAAIDADGRIRNANSAFFRIFPQLAVGASVHDQNSLAPEAKRLLQHATTNVAAHSVYNGRWTLDLQPSAATEATTPVAASTTRRTYDVYSSPFTMDDARGQILTLVDVSQAVAAEEAARRSESLAAVGQASAQLAHEIKNPLGSIRLGISLLRDTARDKDSQNTIDLVERGISHLNKLVVDVTQFSRRQTLQTDDTELHQTLDESLELINDLINEKRTKVEKRYSPEPLRGEWDEDKLRQVFVNLFANAIDASEAGAPLIITTERINDIVADAKGNGTRASQATQPFARLIIEDHGAGMGQETQARIFEPFFTTKKRGTGLGLAIVKQLIELHGGTITVASAPGKGTRFTINLPLKDSDK